MINVHPPLNESRITQKRGKNKTVGSFGWNSPCLFFLLRLSSALRKPVSSVWGNSWIILLSQVHLTWAESLNPLPNSEASLVACFYITKWWLYLKQDPKHISIDQRDNFPFKLFFKTEKWPKLFRIKTGLFQISNLEKRGKEKKKIQTPNPQNNFKCYYLLIFLPYAKTKEILICISVFLFHPSQSFSLFFFVLEKTNSNSKNQVIFTLCCEIKVIKAQLKVRLISANPDFHLNIFLSENNNSLFFFCQKTETAVTTCVPMKDTKHSQHPSTSVPWRNPAINSQGITFWPPRFTLQ